MIPKDFWLRRLHSFAGFALVLFIIFHLLTNSQAAFFIGQDGAGFIHGVNAIQDIPYLPIVEVLLLGLPILIHAALGVHYLFSASFNSFPTNGASPSLLYGRNVAYTWQRLTSWILLIGIGLHVAQMRFIDRPEAVLEGHTTVYALPLSEDTGLRSLSERLNVKLTESKQGKVVAIAKDYGTAELLLVRETFKSPLMMGLYTIFVLAACFHAFNGLWTFMITWGVTLSTYSQRLMLKLTTALMFVVTFLGLSTIYLTYFVNLRQ